MAETPLPFTEVQAGVFGSREMALRLMYESPTYGLDGGEFGIGIESRKKFDQGVFLFNAQYDLNFADTRGMGVDIGGGFRWLQNVDVFRGSRPRIFGVSLWYDGTKTELENYFNQVGVTFESLGELWDFRFNANVPVGDTTLQGEGVLTNDLGFSENFLTRVTQVPTDHAVTVIDFEVARRLLDREAWVFGGGYGLETTGERTFGGKGGVRGFMTKDLMLQLEATHDDLFKTNVAFTVVWYPGRCRCSEDRCPTINDRMLEPVIRHNYVATRRTVERGNVPLTDENNALLRIVHVDSNAGGVGDGTFEHPFADLGDVYPGSHNGDVVLVHADSAYHHESIVLHDLQRLLGEGGGVTHTVATSTFGLVTIPETSPGALHGAIPVINDAPGAAITLGNAATTHSQNDTVSSNEVSNLSIDGGTKGIVSASHGIAEADINHMTIANTTGNGIELRPFVETISETSSKLIRFNPAIDQNTFDNVGGNDIDLDATTSEPASTAFDENIQVTENTSTNGNGRGVNIENNLSVATIRDYTYDGGATGGGGLRFANSQGGADVSDASISNGSGPGIDIDSDSQGTFTFTTTTVTDTGGEGVRLNGGTATVDFTGKIIQGADAPAVSISGGHHVGTAAGSGAVTFTEQITGDGVIDATNGTGLVFDNAQGTYTFDDAVKLHGGEAGVDIENSSGLFTFSNTTIENPNNIGFNLNGGTADVDFTGKITQNVHDTFAAVSIKDHQTGTVAFSEATGGAGVVEATKGTGLEFENADSTYTFNHAITLSGGPVVEIRDDSAGTFNFNGASSQITNNEGTAFTVDQSSATVTYKGKIDSSGTGKPVEILDNTGGTVTFTGAITSEGDGIVVADNAGGVFNFNGAVTLEGGTAGINIENDVASKITFANATVTSPAASAFRLYGGTADVDFTGKITQDTAGEAAVEIGGGHKTGVVTFNEKTTDDGVISATGSDGLQFNDADGTYKFNHAVTLSGGTAGINIENDSSGTFTFSKTTITNPTGTAFNLNGGTAAVTFIGKIAQDTAGQAAVAILGGHSGTVDFTEGTSGDGVVSAAGGTGLEFTNADGTYNFNSKVVLSGTAGINIGWDGANGSNGSFDFVSASEISNTSGTAFTVDHSAATVTYGGKITSTGTGAPVTISNNTGGNVILSGEIKSTTGGILFQDNSGGTFSLSNAASEIANTTGTGFTADGNAATISYAGKITSSGAGKPVEILNNTGGNVTLSGQITSSAEGISVHDNTGGAFNFNGLAKLDTAANDAVTLLNNSTAATTIFANLAVTTTSGIGLKTSKGAGSSGGTLQITGSNNTIASTGGAAVDMSDTTIGASNIAFKSLSADGGANGIVLANILGGSFTVGSAGVSPGDGGTIQNTTGAGISITNTAVASLNNMLIKTTGGDGVSLAHDNTQSFNVTIAKSSITDTTGAGIDLAVTGTGTTRVNFNNNAIDNTDDQGILIAISGGSPSTSNITLNTNNVANSSNNEAMLLTVAGTGAKTVNFLAENNHFSNNDPTASAFDIQANGAVTLNTTVHNNTFANANTVSGRAYETSTNNGAASVRLSLLNNAASKGAGNPDKEYLLANTAGTFTVEALTATPPDDVQNKNTPVGQIEIQGTINNDPGNIPTP